MNAMIERSQRFLDRTLGLAPRVLLLMVLAIALLIKETAYLFAAFMVLGPALLFAAAALLGWHILAELRAKKVL